MVANTVIILLETYFRLNGGRYDELLGGKKKEKPYPLSFYHDAEINPVLPLCESNRFGLWSGGREGQASQTRDGRDGGDGKRCHSFKAGPVQPS